MFGLITAFQSYDIYSGFWHSPWAGRRQLPAAVRRPDVLARAVQNTLVISAVQLVLYFPMPIVLALLFNSVMPTARVRSFVQSVVYLPHFFSWVLVVTVFQQMLGGAGAAQHLAAPARHGRPGTS